ncbi:hypothetical protein B9Z55_018579 [Caenorhabditis nigoni]|uniref:Neurotransmitter-gated ion-channel ligand-binding domain-containing protein n=1 Tax=Caenorhabditis nigoni TaxID=1611254 RepID=A0A2G5TFF9_9PELO|nr:hypothetical protein B9Z55_018579 [Caenorhabditis nigoni]
MRLPYLFLNLLVAQLFGQEVHELQSECLNEARLMSKLLTEREYSKHKIPKKGGITVSVEFWIQEISSISEMTNDFEMEIYINEMWTDPNLKFSHLGACKANLTLDEQTLNKLWKPNTCFVNSKFAEIYESPFQNVFLTLFDNGTVWVNYRLRVKGPCEMELTNFPMDTQACRLNYQRSKLENCLFSLSAESIYSALSYSFSYNNEEVRLQWNSQRKPVFAIQPVCHPISLEKIRHFFTDKVGRLHTQGHNNRDDFKGKNEIYGIDLCFAGHMIFIQKI